MKLAKRARFVVSEYLLDAGLTEVLSTAAGEAGLSGHMQTQGTFVIPHTLNKLTLVATQLKEGHFCA